MSLPQKEPSAYLDCRISLPRLLYICGHRLGQERTTADPGRTSPRPSVRLIRELGLL